MEIDYPITQKQKLEVVDERDGDSKRPKLHYIQNLEVFEERDGHMQNLEVPDDNGEIEIEYGNWFSCKVRVFMDEDPVTDDEEDDEEVEPYVERDYEDATMEYIPSPDRPIPFIYAGDTIDIIDLLFTAKRSFLLKNNGGMVMADDLKDKTIVLYLVPLDADAPNEPWTSLDMIDAYNELFPKGDVEFVFVAVPIRYAPEAYFRGQKQRVEPPRDEQEAHYLRLFSKLPFPAIPFGDDEYDQRRLVRAFKLDLIAPGFDTFLPYWSIIDSTTKTVVASISDWNCLMLFHYYAAAELYPLTTEHIHNLTIQSTKPGDILNDLDQILTSFNRDSLLRPSTGEKVHVSYLEKKIIGLYFCEDRPNPPHMDLIEKVYDKVKMIKPGFEIVQTYVRFNPITGVCTRLEGLSQQQSVSKQQAVKWLILPFDDPRRKKLVRIFSSVCDRDDVPSINGCLVFVQPRRDTFEFSGAEILRAYGADGYPFTQERLFEVEKKIHNETLKLNLLFLPGKCYLYALEGNKYVSVDNTQLYGKKVMVLFARYNYLEFFPDYVPMLASKYQDARNAKKDEFEVVFVSFDNTKSKFVEHIKDMPWLVSYSQDLECELKNKLFKRCGRFMNFTSGVAAFGEDGELITKCYGLSTCWEKKTDQFPFLLQSFDQAIRWEVNCMCLMDKYYIQRHLWNF